MASIPLVSSSNISRDSKSSRGENDDDDANIKTSQIARTVLKEEQPNITKFVKMEDKERKSVVCKETSERVALINTESRNRKQLKVKENKAAVNDVDTKSKCSLDDESAVSSRHAEKEDIKREAEAELRVTQQIVEAKNALFEIDRSKKSRRRAANTTLNLMNIIRSINKEELPTSGNECKFLKIGENLIKTLLLDINPLDQDMEDFSIRSVIIRNSFETMQTLLEDIIKNENIKNFTQFSLDDPNNPKTCVIRNFKQLTADWKRSLILATYVDCGYPNKSVGDRINSKNFSNKQLDLAKEAQEMFNQRSKEYKEVSFKLLKDPCKFSHHHLVTAEFKFYSGDIKRIQFHVADVCASELNRYTSSAYAISEISIDMEIQLRLGLNCFSFATGYEVPNNRLIPGALPGEDKTHPIAWISDKALQDQGLIRIDTLLCGTLNYDLLEIEAPYYLIAIIHSGEKDGSADAHVIRCFAYNQELVWLQSGGKKIVTFVKGPNMQLINGIPTNPKEAFCDADSYPCFLGYYLVPDSVNIYSPTGDLALYVQELG